MLIIAAAYPVAAATLKVTLNNFAQATGLTINFSKNHSSHSSYR